MKISLELFADVTGEINIMSEYFKIENNGITYVDGSYSPELLKYISLDKFTYLRKD
jgi:hypothetical protein